MGLFGKLKEIKTERNAKKKMERWDKARQFEEEVGRVRRKYPNLTYEEAKIVAKKNLRKRKRKRTTTKDLLKRGLGYAFRSRRGSRGRRR